MTSPSPLRTTDRLRDRLTEAVLAQASFSHPGLNQFLRQRLRGSSKAQGALVGDPLIEAVAPFVPAPETLADLSGSLLDPRVVDALTRGKPGEDYRFDPVMHPYAHQVDAWRCLVEPRPRSLLVTSGTGSGKTECFLVPLLHDLVVNDDGQPGVRAIVLYPLNALIASQQTRLRRWMRPFEGRMRFGLYNGLTPEEVRASEASDHLEEARCRKTIRERPPQVLVTNVSMMEYLTIRRKDRPLLDNSRGRLRWIILDEAHSYIGSAAAEVALLLRRVMMAFGVQARDVRFVATSATIGGGPDTGPALARFLADLAGIGPDQVTVVEGRRDEVRLPEASLARHAAVRGFVHKAQQEPVPLPEIEAMLRLAELDPATVVESLAGDEGGQPLLPLRVHQFMRAVPGLWSCLNAGCTGARPDGWPFGAVLFERTDTCPACKAQVFEVTGCRGCGEPFLAAFQRGDLLCTGTTAPTEDEFAAAAEQADAEDADTGNAEDEDAPGTPPPTEKDRRLLATRPLPGFTTHGVDLMTGRLLDRRIEGQQVPVTAGQPATCPECRTRAPKDGTVDRPFRFGVPFLVGNAVPVVLEGVPPVPHPGQALPAEGRGLLSFSDSRQGTARLAAAVETGSERAYVRGMLYHMAQKAAQPLGESDRALTKLDKEIADLEAAMSTHPGLRSVLDDKKANRAFLLEKGQAGAPWSDVARSIAQDPQVNHWIRAVWQDRDARFLHGDRTALGHFLMLRELAKRPQRANAAETLGLVQLRFGPIESRGSRDIPQPLLDRDVSADAWRDFLYLLLDTPVRSNFALRMDDDDVRWLVPRGGRRRNIVGPGRPRDDRADLGWPQARAGGSRTSAQIWLERRLGFDPTRPGDRAAMNEVFQAAWDQLQPLFDTAGNDRSLDLGRAEVAAVGRAWRCPVTHRVLTRLAFGRTPYGQRDGAPQADQEPEELAFPALPTVFPGSTDRDRMESWLHADEAVSALRRRGMWGNLHDRAALLSPFLRAEEHSAQQPPHRLRRFEDQFKQGEINLLACSTTMEMGVDIGSVSAVLMTNVPPSVANYRQRVGRAGRRGQGFASSLTFARATPLDQAAFLDPGQYLRRPMLPPEVRLQSRQIVQRHVNALLLSSWFAREGGELLKADVGTFFGLGELKDAAPKADSPAKAFHDWLKVPGTATALADATRRLVDGTALQGRDDLPLRTLDAFDEQGKRLADQWRSLQDEWMAAGSDAAGRSIEMGVRRLCRESLIKELANRAVLPGHGFPTAVVPFQIDLDAARDAPDDRMDKETEGGARNRRYDYPSRNADAALREYAPGAEVVIDGLVWVSAGLTLNWRRPASQNAAREIQDIRWHWSCTRCGAADCAHTKIDTCSACGSTEIRRTHFIQPAGFRVDSAVPPHAGTDQVRFIPTQPVHVSTRRAAWEPLLDPRLGRGRTSAEGQVFHSTCGTAGRGFHVCLVCGRAAEDRAGLADHVPVWCQAEKHGGKARRPPRCPGNDQSFAVTDPLALGYELQTDVAEPQFPGLDDAGGAIAMAAVLRDTHARRLGIDVRELGFGTAARQGHLGQKTQSMFLFDRNAGGAGFATRLLDDVPALLRDARQVLECQMPGCQRGCPACVITADMTDQQQRDVDRHPARNCLRGLADGFSTVAPADQAMPGAHLSRPVADALVRRMAPGDTATLYVHEPFDLGALDELPFTALFGAARRVGTTCRLALLPAVMAGLNDAERHGLRDAAIRGGFIVAMATPGRTANDAPWLASLVQSDAKRAWFGRDGGAAQLGQGWGTGVQRPVVEAEVDALPEQTDVPPEALDPKLLDSSLAEFDRTAPCTLSRFGAALVQLLRPHLEATGMWRPGELTALSYSDRYLQSPLAVGLALHTLGRLRLELAPKGKTIPLGLQLQAKTPENRGPPRSLQHDWQRAGDRDQVATLLARALGMDLVPAATAPGHARIMTLSYGMDHASLFFDQGFGYWRASGQAGFDFLAKPDHQARQLTTSQARVAGTGHSYIAVSRSTA